MATSLSIERSSDTSAVDAEGLNPTERRGCLDERVNRLARGDIDGCGAHVESGVSHHLRRGVGVLATHVGQ